jgi:hypothetical protein
MADEPTPQIEQETPGPVETKPVRHANPTVQLGGVVIAVILAFAALVWAQGIRLGHEKREAFGRGIDGLAASLAIPVVETNSVKLENRGARLQAVVEAIQRAGQYDVVVVTDANGNVIASTDTSLQGQTLKELSEAKSPTTETEANGMIEAVTAIEANNNKVGALRVRAKL